MILAAKADGTKLKPFIVFKGVRPVTGRKAPNKELAGQNWTKDFRVHVQGWLKKSLPIIDSGC